MPSEVLVMLQVPPAVATALPTGVVPSNSVTVFPAGAKPVKVGVVMLVTLSVFDAPLSDAGVRSGADGAAGATVSIVTAKAAEGALTLPAVSVSVVVSVWLPFPRAVLVMLQVPPAVATPLPTGVVPSNSVTVLPAGAEPMKVGVVTLVMLSLFDAPVSDAGVRSGADGAAGAIVSIVTASAAEGALTLPAVSASVAVNEWLPLPSAVLVMLQVPPAVATALPTGVVPSSNVTVLPAGAEPVKVGVVTLVTLSVFDAPVSDAGVRSGAEGAAGVVVWIVTAKAAEGALTLPAGSVSVAVSV